MIRVCVIITSGNYISYFNPNTRRNEIWKHSRNLILKKRCILFPDPRIVRSNKTSFLLFAKYERTTKIFLYNAIQFCPS